MGTIDPTPHLNDTAMYTLGTMMVVAALSHSLVKPLNNAVIEVKETPAIPRL
jgi:hypothetical protein